VMFTGGQERVGRRAMVQFTGCASTLNWSTSQGLLLSTTTSNSSPVD